MTHIHGHTAPGFERLKEVFAAGFEGRPSMGAGLHVKQGGRVLADLWGGIADPKTGRDWQADTPAVVFSCTKGLMSILAARAVQAGLFDYDTKVAALWPEFAAMGKADVTVAQALSHRAGLSALRDDLTEAEMLDWSRVTTALAAQEPLWPPGSAHHYHPLTHGWLAGEILARATGLRPGALFAREITAPLQADAWIGLPEAVAPRVARSQVSAPLQQLWKDEAAKPAPNWPYRAMTLGHALPADLVTEDGGFNAPNIRAAEIPGAGGIASARALATIWQACVADRPLIDPALRARATVVQSEGPPFFGGEPPFCRWGMGFQLDSPARRYVSDTSFGHDGAGGQSAFADAGLGLGFAFVTNWMMGPEDTRAHDLTTTLRDLL